MWKQMGDEFKVGVFTLIALTTLGYMLLVLNPNMLKDSTRVQYYTILRDAGGIIQKTHVKTNGVTIGKVRAVELEVDDTRIVVEIDANIKLPVGSKIEVRTRGLLGDVYLEIVRADDTGAFIERGGLIPKSDDQIDMQGMMALIGNIGKDVKKITGTVANVLGGSKGEETFANIVDNIEEFSSDLRKTTASIRGAIGDDPEGIKNIVKNLQKSLVSIKEFSGNLNSVLDDANKERLNRIIASFDDSMAEVKGATKSIRLISDKIEKGEGTIGKLVNDDTAIVEIEQTLKDLREALSPATKMVITLDTHAEARGDKTGQTYLNVMMRMRPDRFYLIGMTDVTESVRDTKTEAIETDAGTTDRPASTTVRERTTERKAMRFNLQLAKSWYFVTARLGLFESTGGGAVDFKFFHDRLRFSFEAFDFKSYDNEWRRVARLKSYMQVLFLDHIYLMAGVDDITRKKNKFTYLPQKGPVPFGGLGLAFNDQDLKSLMGAAAMAR
jgi:phospholipid/cholesterol/gamma-HCH transport system substrate-binding protein